MANKTQSKNPPEKKSKTSTISKGPPDGGWGWFVVFGSFMIHVVTDGVTYSFGVLYTEFLNVFNESKGATAWIASLLVGITLCSGPIASIFVNKYGCRAVTIAGAIIASAFLLVSALFANSVKILYVTIGIGTGLGFGMIYLPAIVSVTCYFEKYRSLATGIAVCGSGFGTFLFSPFVDHLVQNFGWRVTVVVISGLVFLCILFGALFRPLKTSEDEEQEQEQQLQQQQLTSDNNTITSPIVMNVIEPPTECEPLNGTVGSKSCDGLPSDEEDHEDGVGQWHRRQWSERKVSHNKLLSNEVKTNTFGNDLDKQSRFALSQPELIVATVDSNRRLNTNKRDEFCYASQNLKPSHINGGIMYQKDIFYSGSLKNININHTSRTLSQLTNVGTYDSEMANTIDNEKFSDGVCCTADAKNTIKQMLDLSLLKDPVFILYSISNFLTSIGFNIPYLYIVPQAVLMGIPSNQASYLLSFLGVANTLGRIILGFISDKPWINRLMVYNVCLTICGIATILSTYCTDMLTFSFYTIVFGSTIGAYVGLTSVILVDLLGLDKLTNAFGVLLLFQGIASLVGPPIAGWLYDVLGSYYPGFYVAGANIAVSGLMLFIIPFVQRRCERKGLEKMTSLVNN